MISLQNDHFLAKMEYNPEKGGPVCVWERGACVRGMRVGNPLNEDCHNWRSFRSVRRRHPARCSALLKRGLRDTAPIVGFRVTVYVMSRKSRYLSI